MIGKSPEYIQVYVDVYQKEVRSQNIKAASGGCLASALVISWLLFVDANDNTIRISQ